MTKYDSTKGLIIEVLKLYKFLPKKDQEIVKDIILKDTISTEDADINVLTSKVNYFISYSILLGHIFDIKKLLKKEIKIDLSKIMDYEKIYDFIRLHIDTLSNVYDNKRLVNEFDRYMFSIKSIQLVIDVYPEVLKISTTTDNINDIIPVIESNNDVISFIKKNIKIIDKQSDTFKIFIYYVFENTKKDNLVDYLNTGYEHRDILLNYVTSYKDIKHMLKYYKAFIVKAKQIDEVYIQPNENIKTMTVLKMVDIASRDYIHTLIYKTDELSTVKIRQKIIKNNILR